MKKYKTIAELKAAVDAGEIDESKMCVVQDNDCSHVHFGPYVEDAEDNTVFEGNGYDDTDPLWKALFPKATVEWC